MEPSPRFIPLTLSWNLTKRCNLACAHCYIDASSRDRGNGELSPSEAMETLHQLAAVNSEAVLILTGGEPLLRKDLFDLVAEASRLGFWTVLGSHGGLLDGRVADRLITSGLKGVGVSLDSVHPEKHNRFRGIEKSWEKTVEAMEVMREKSLPFLVEMTLTRENQNELEEMAALTCEKGGTALNVFFLVPTGRGANLTDLSPEEYEEGLFRMARLQRAYAGRLLVNGKCAPHYRRVLWESDTVSPFVRTFKGGGCPAGTYYCRVTPEGNVTPCPYMPLPVGNVREKSFSEIWNGSEILRAFRTQKPKGRCGICEFSELCGGCRCRAYAATGDYLAEDPSCAYQPGKYPNTPIPLPPERTYGSDAPAELEWTEEATLMLKRVPFFARGMVRRAVEAHAKAAGQQFITGPLMIEMRKAMTGRFPWREKS